MQCHPCFDEQAHWRVGRVHLPVAPRCNIQCAFCERRICANLTMQHPGWARELLPPSQAAELVRELAQSRGETFVVGVAGPGEPLANPETFEALRTVHQEHPALLKCLSTNGLLLAEKLPQMLAVGISSVTVTINAADGEVGERIYAWVRHTGRVRRGREAADLLIEHQFAGLRAALAAGLAVKVNTVLIPGVNDAHVVDLARRLKELGVPLMNLMPLIPGGQMRDRRAPTCEELRQARSECEAVIAQFRLCEQCSADVVRFPEKAHASGRGVATFDAAGVGGTYPSQGLRP
jgi:nitrogen fixation protein NifB